MHTNVSEIMLSFEEYMFVVWIHQLKRDTVNLISEEVRYTVYIPE